MLTSSKFDVIFFRGKRVQGKHYIYHNQFQLFINLNVTLFISYRHLNERVKLLATVVEEQTGVVIPLEDDYETQGV